MRIFRARRLRVFDETHTFTSSLLNDFRIGVNTSCLTVPNTTFASSVAALAASSRIAGTTVGSISGLSNITFTSAASNGNGIGNYWQGMITNYFLHFRVVSTLMYYLRVSDAG